jgi:hypothetical protein
VTGINDDGLHADALSDVSTEDFSAAFGEEPI